MNADSLDRPRHVVFASRHCLIDYSSGAAIATNDCLQLLARSGFRCQAFCAGAVDFQEEVCLERMLARLQIPFETLRETAGGRPVELIRTRCGAVPVTVFRNPSSRRGPGRDEAPAFLAALEAFLERSRPDVVLTYGGGPLSEAIVALAQQHRAALVFALKNLAYRHARTFQNVDCVFVPSAYARDYYRARLGLKCAVLPNAIDPLRVQAAVRRPQYLTFVNPQPAKGLFVFARIAEQIARRRPDIPMLVVDSRGGHKGLANTGVDLRAANNLFGMPNTPDPRMFYAVTKVILVPSLVAEAFGNVAAEAMLNGIPVLASTRGALPETVGQGGILLDIPPQYTPRSTVAPTAGEVEPWVDTVLRLWDDDAFYRAQAGKARHESQRWQLERIGPVVVHFFRNVRPRSAHSTQDASRRESPPRIDTDPQG